MLTQGLELVIHLLEIIGASMLILGFIVATAKWMRQAFQGDAVAASPQYRKELGRSVLIGLEILVAATIIKTITVEPSLEGVGLLGLMVIIRTLLGWATVLEISGRWPWRHG